MVDYVLITRGSTGNYLVREVCKEIGNLEREDKLFQTFNLAFEYARKIDSVEGVVIDPELNHLLSLLTIKDDTNLDFPSYSSYELIGRDGLVNFDEYGEFVTVFIINKVERGAYLDNNGYSRLVISILRNEYPAKSIWSIYNEGNEKIDFELNSSEKDGLLKGLEYINSLPLNNYFSEFDKSEAVAILNACEKSVNFIN